MKRDAFGDDFPEPYMEPTDSPATAADYALMGTVVVVGLAVLAALVVVGIRGCSQ